MSTVTHVEEVAKILRGMLGKHTLDDACAMLSTVARPDDVARARKLLEDEIDRIRILRDPPTMEDSDIESWYPGPADTDRFWPPLTRHLIGKGIGEDAVKQLDRASTKIVSLLHHPGLGRFQTRGLVAGDVQSGKTANFTAVIAKAADVGYRMFIVLSGITNKLRQQTQLRLDDELVRLNPEHWIGLTDGDRDFGSVGELNANALLTKYAHQRTLVVVKKHSGRLGKLLRWLRAAHEDVLNACPILVIDDEADQASINTSSDPEEPSG